MKEIALHLLDIAENSLEAGATVVELVLELTPGGMLEISILDNGRGMDDETLKMTSDPFFTSRTTRRVGMGIPLLRQHAELTGGHVEIRSEKGKGTELKAVFVAGHPDIQPLGDIEGCWMMLAAFQHEANIVMRCKTPKGDFEISSEQAKQELDVERFDKSELKEALKRLIRNNLAAIGFNDGNIDKTLLNS
jgi:anti-sigma regulatory factor (Ser/Thr protein kinase)